MNRPLALHHVLPLVGVVALGLIGLVARDVAERLPEPPGPTPPVPHVDPPIPALHTPPVSGRLADLPVASETASGSYDRAAFGDWDTAPDGCTTRQRVLIDESRTPAQVGADCDVVAGDWLSIYDGYQTTNPTELEIDHVVALAEAWESGAAAWSQERREQFANDIAHPGALVAVTAASNRAKSDHDPSDWMPSNRSAWCQYAGAWIDTKAAWGLAVDPTERDALANVLATCPPNQGGTP